MAETRRNTRIAGKGATKSIPRRSTRAAPRDEPHVDKYDKFFLGEYDEPVEVTVEVMRRTSIHSDELINAKLQSVNDFDLFDFLMPLIYLFTIFVVQLMAQFFVSLVIVGLVVMLQLYLLYDLLARIRRRPSGPIIVGMIPPGDEKYGWKWAFLLYACVAPICFGLAFLEQYLFFRLIPWLSPLGGAPQSGEGSVGANMLGLFAAYQLTMLLIHVFQTVIMAPVTEELWFRGIGLAGFLRTGSRLRAVTWTSVLFGLAHGPGRVLFTTFFGFILSLIRFRTGSMYCCIGVHFLHNVLATLIGIIMMFLYFV